MNAGNSQQKICELRGEKVMLDFDLAILYNVETKVLNQAVKRNSKRFPDDFMFQLDENAYKNLKSQFVTSNWGGTRKLPYAFTEHGVTMLAGILRKQCLKLLNRTHPRCRQTTGILPNPCKTYQLPSQVRGKRSVT